jgi:anti-sigma-K factor RskA
MIPPEHISEPHDCGADVAAYALGALDPAEAETFRRHLGTCAVCRDELTAFEQVVDLLPVSAPPRAAPASLRRSVLRAVREEPRRDRGARTPRTSARRAGSWLPRPALGVAAALAVVLVVFAVARLAAPSSHSTRVIHAQVTGQGTAELRLSGDRGELVMHHFALPPAGQIYEVWLMRSGHAPTPTNALFSVTSKGDGDVAVPGNLNGVAQVLVTPEPAGGTSTPTHVPVISATLS